MAQLSLGAGVPAGDLYGTRTSSRWATQPGRMDPLNLQVVWPRTGKYGIPALEPCDFEPNSLAAWHHPKSLVDAVGTGAIHFFLDDYRFESVWAKPEKSLDRVKQVGAALTPDFSVWRDMPHAAQIWQTYRSRWCGAFWQHNGMKVIPTVSWGDPETYEFAFEGLPESSVLAVSALGVRDDTARQLFQRGLIELIDRTAPTLLLSYGRLPEAVPVKVRQYPTFWDVRRWK